jgi:hypothetical protein
MSAARPPVAVRVFAAFLVARAIFGMTYIGAALERLPVVWYYPLDHTWELSRRPHGPAMGWYGLTAAALIAAAAGGALTFLASVLGPLARALARASVVVAIAHAGGLVLLVDFVYFGWTLTHEAPQPWAEPSCPQPSPAPRDP